MSTLSQLRSRVAPEDFGTPQRLEFDLILRLDTGVTTHTVDFTPLTCEPGDVVWVRSGQVHQWTTPSETSTGTTPSETSTGTTPSETSTATEPAEPAEPAEGTVIMFLPDAIGPYTRTQILSAAVAPPSFWAAPGLAASGAAQALDLVATIGNPSADARLRVSALARALGSFLLLLADVDGGDRTQREAPPEVLVWFRDAIEAHFRTRHQVAQYAERLGYSTRTLNRLAREWTGHSAKQLIDERVVLEAKRALAHREDPVSEVAASLGFDDPSNFSKYFLQRTGSTPGAFRRLANGR